MAFLPTMSLFLLAAVNNAATDVAEAPVADVVADEVEQEEEIMEDEPAQGGFQSCMEGTEWAAADAQAGHQLSPSDTCESTFAAEECLTFPADGKNCCPQVCNSEHICSGDSFVNVQDDVDADVNAVTECLERTFEPSNFAFWKWGATWMRTKYNSCEKNYALGYTPDNELGMALCCPNASESEEPAVEDAAARMLAEAVSGPTKYYNNMLRDKMCVGGPVTSAPGAPTDTTVDGPAKPNKENKEEENKENKDKKDKKDKETMVEGSASTFGFTALALMLVTA